MYMCGQGLCIVKEGPTDICIFKGKRDTLLHCEILQRTLYHFCKTNFQKLVPSHWFMQNNDPKHCSCIVQKIYDEVAGMKLTVGHRPFSDKFSDVTTCFLVCLTHFRSSNVTVIFMLVLRKLLKYKNSRGN